MDDKGALEVFVLCRGLTRAPTICCVRTLEVVLFQEYKQGGSEGFRGCFVVEAPPPVYSSSTLDMGQLLFSEALQFEMVDLQWVFS